MSTKYSGFFISYLFFLFGHALYAQSASKFINQYKERKINQHAYMFTNYKGNIVILDQTIIDPIPENKSFMVSLLKASKGMDVPQAFVKVLGKEKIKSLPADGRINVGFRMDHTGRILGCRLSFPESYGITLDECDRLIVFIKKNVTLNVPKYAREGMFSEGSYSMPISWIQK